MNLPIFLDLSIKVSLNEEDRLNVVLAAFDTEPRRLTQKCN